MWLWELWVSISLTRCDLKHLLCRGGRGSPISRKALPLQASTLTHSR